MVEGGGEEVRAEGFAAPTLLDPEWELSGAFGADGTPMAVLLDAEAIHRAVEFITDADFFRDAHRRIFAKMLELAERSQAIDFITLKDELGRSSDLDQVGGDLDAGHAGGGGEVEA